MKPKQFILFLLLCTYFTSSAQKVKTEYLDKHWIKTNKKNAAYYRHIQKIKDSINVPLYLVKDYYITDTLQMQGTYLDERLKINHGKFIYYYPNGKKKTEAFYIQDTLQGSRIEYYKNGNMKTVKLFHKDTLLKRQEFYENGAVEGIAYYKNRKENGTSKFYYPNGVIKRIDEFKEGEFVSGKCFTHSGNDTAFFPAMTRAKFSGGNKAFINYVRKGIQDKSLSCGWFKGEFIFIITIDENGKVTESYLIYYSDDCYLKNLFTILENSPPWTPAVKEGVTTEETLYFRITFPEQFWQTEYPTGF